MVIVKKMVKSSVLTGVVGSSDCRDCLGQPPPHFGLPPPPMPPYTHDLTSCNQAHFFDIKTCRAVPVIDAEYHSSPVLPSLGLIIICSVLLLGIFSIVITLLWKHKKKMQNFSPCKSSPQNHDVAQGNNVIYEDLTNICPRQLNQQSVPIVELKNQNIDVPYHVSLFACPPRPPSNGYSSQDPYNPIYEELSYGCDDREGSVSEMRAPLSDDDFAEDELSIGERAEPCHQSRTSPIQDSTGNHLCHDTDNLNENNRYLPRHGHQFSLLKDYSNKRSCRKRDTRFGSMDRSHGRNHKEKFTENILLDAFFHYQPNHLHSPYTLSVSSGHCDVPSYSSRQEFTTFRPSQDSDSGYSHNTFGGRESSQGRTDYHLPYSLDFILS